MIASPSVAALDEAVLVEHLGVRVAVDARGERRPASRRPTNVNAFCGRVNAPSNACCVMRDLAEQRVHLRRVVDAADGERELLAAGGLHGQRAAHAQVVVLGEVLGHERVAVAEARRVEPLQRTGRSGRSWPGRCR